jgi:hypothetical protein
MNKKPVQNELGKLDKLNQQEVRLLRMIQNEQKLAKEKFPLIFALTATFGIVATVSGFGKTIDKIPMLRDHPYILIIIGATVLIITGAVYKRN